ncbi:hypothetical protein Fot_25880 [Forsythia ovata]|uniref:Flavin-containing monooxygenase n=1 Tax=Forsythia ovata TaxID=205694 RepID=A0ABD1UAE9_9LAMI
MAVIGAGVAGLAAARELRREGQKVVVVYEKSDQLGRTWVYDPRVESDPLGLDPNREIAQAENSALRMANARVLLDNLKMSQELENRRCPTWTKSSSLERLQIESAILREEIDHV